ncbi:conserved exported hypothetical protein [Verrucomicrobia bacterium]|nr:conserved exported hypothetical protein [Verrucomicrobiota bacterium]
MGSLLVIVAALLLPRPRSASPSSSRVPANRESDDTNSAAARAARIADARRALGVRSKPAATKTPEQIVGEKLAFFARSRRKVAEALARRHGIDMPEDVKRFFDAVESGDWDRIQAAYKVINGGDKSVSHGANRPPGVNELWSAIADAYGVAEQVHLWPARQLLDYGNAVLGALPPGMAYVGGTDNGRWIPELLNETGDGEPRIIITQNGLADGMYLEYITEQYGDRLTTLTQDDSQRAFQDYIADARQRLEHDQQFPDEPKQVLPGENISETDGQITVSGQVAVMQINQTLLQMLLQKNPELPFALQESFPLRATYPQALPLGPLMQLNAQDAQDTFTGDLASQSVDYWQTAAQNLLADADSANSETVLKAYSKDAASAGNLLAAHGYTDQAQQAYRISTQLWPASPEAVHDLATLLQQTGHADQAAQLLDDFARNFPDPQPDAPPAPAADPATPPPAEQSSADAAQ